MMGSFRLESCMRYGYLDRDFYQDSSIGLLDVLLVIFIKILHLVYLMFACDFYMTLKQSFL